MPLKDRDAKLKYQREWYAAHRERVIKKVHERKWTLYAGTCIVCGGKTMGNTKGAAPDYCAKPACHSAQRKENAELYAAWGRKPWDDAKRRKRREVRQQQIVSLEDLADAY